MTTFLLHLTARDLTVRFPTAAEAYQWLDDHARRGEPYRLGCADEEMTNVTVIEAGTYEAPDRGVA
jgi:hypothetical protein